MSTYEANELTWDTQYFGHNSLKVILSDVLTEKDFSEIIDVASKYEFIAIVNENNEAINNNKLQNLNPYLVDINVQLYKGLEVSSDTLADNGVRISNELEYNEAILEIAEESFVHSRFFNDPYLDKGKSNKIYYEWVKNSFNIEGKYFTRIYKDTTILGFLLFSLNDSNEGIIELIATDPKCKANGIGSKLIDETEKFLISKGILTIKVGTQVNNIPAINFYFKNGYKMLQVNSVFHYWPKEGEFDE